MMYQKRHDRYVIAEKKFKYLGLSKHCWLAGGALRALFASEPIKDIDLFFAKEAKRLAKQSELERAGYKVIVDNSTVTRVIKGKAVIDLVKRTFANPQETIHNFDFTVTCFALDNQGLYFHPQAFEHLASRSLYMNSLPYPVQTLVRLQRYAMRGYRACPEELRKLAARLAQLTEQEVKDAHLYHAID